MKLFAALVLLSLLCVSSVFAEGGSSGVGSAMPVANGISAALPDGFVKVVSGVIQDGDQPILSLTTLTPDQIKELEIIWTKARLGSVNGYEFWPTPESHDQNTWVICTRTKDQCTKLTPLSKTNRKVPAVLGSLFRQD